MVYSGPGMNLMYLTCVLNLSYMKYKLHHRHAMCADGTMLEESCVAVALCMHCQPIVIVMKLCSLKLC